MRITSGSGTVKSITGKKDPNRAYVPNLTLSVRFGHKYDDQRFSNLLSMRTKNNAI